MKTIYNNRTYKNMGIPRLKLYFNFVSLVLIIEKIKKISGTDKQNVQKK